MPIHQNIEIATHHPKIAVMCCDVLIYIYSAHVQLSLRLLCIHFLTYNYHSPSHMYTVVYNYHFCISHAHSTLNSPYKL